MVKNHHLAINEPMDFATIRAKVHEGMYTTLEQFKRDVFQICFNAMNAYPANSKYYKAEFIGGHAISVFESLNAHPQHFDLEVSLNKKRPSKKPQNRQLGTSRARASAKTAGRKNATRSKVPKTEKRDMHWPPRNKSLVSEFLNANKSSLQLNKDPNSYKDSLLRFVKDLGPTAQRAASKKLEANPIPIQSTNLNSAQMLSLALPFFNSAAPLTIPDTTTAAGQQNRNANNIAGSVSISDGANKGGNHSFLNYGWHAFAASLLSSSFCIDDDEDKMVSSMENVFHKIREWNTSASELNTSGSTSSNSVLTIVHPTVVVPSAPQPRPLDSIRSKTLPIRPTPFITQSRQENTMHRINPSSLIPPPRTRNSVVSLCGDSSRLSQPRQGNTFPSLNPSRLSSLMPPPRPRNYVSLLGDSSGLSQPRPENTMPSINPSWLSSLMPPPRPTNPVSLIGDSKLSQPENSMSSIFPSNNNHPTNLSFFHLPRPEDAMPTINLSELSPMCCHSRSVNPMSGNGMNIIPSSGLSLLHSQAANFFNEPDTPLLCLGTPYQPGDFQAIMGSLDFNNSPYPKQVISQMNLLGPVDLQGPNSSSTLQEALSSAMNYNGGGGGAAAALGSQQGEANSQLWNDDQQPNLALQL